MEGESAIGGRRLIPKLYISPVFDRIFGGSYVDITPTGFVNLDFGGLFQYNDNPQIPERQRKNGGFNFNMQISSNVVGKIGDKLAVTFNFDNNNSFDFSKKIKIIFDKEKRLPIYDLSSKMKSNSQTPLQRLKNQLIQNMFQQKNYNEDVKDIIGGGPVPGHIKPIWPFIAFTAFNTLPPEFK